MIIVKVVGGLANQMGGYAAAVGLAQKHDVPLKIDLSGMQRDKLRKLDLDKLNVPIKIATEHEIKKVSSQSRFRMINRLKKSFYKRRGAQDPHIYREKSLCFDPGFYQMPSDVHVIGNFLSVKYYNDIFPVLRELYQVKAPLSQETSRWLDRIVKCKNPVALHVRRTDYVNNQNTIAVHGNATVEYYKNASNHILSRFPDAEFFVFSDDPEWVRFNIAAQAPTYYVDCNDVANGYQDFHLMKHCRHYIMANSGFSRWAALLSENEPGIVIRPSRWFVESIIDDSDIGPDTWLKM